MLSQDFKEFVELLNQYEVTYSSILTNLSLKNFGQPRDNTPRRGVIPRLVPFSKRVDNKFTVVRQCG